MENSNKEKLKELKKRYGWDVAQLSQSKTNDIKDLTDQELLDSLIIYDIQLQLSAVIEDLVPHMTESIRPTLFSSLFGHVVKQLCENYERDEVFHMKMEAIQYFEDIVLGVKAT
jgi:Na+/glutamate symporter